MFFVAKEDAENAINNNNNASISWVPNAAHLTMKTQLAKPLNKSGRNKQMQIVFAGTLYSGGEEVLLKLIRALNTELQYNKQPVAHWTMIGDWSAELMSKVNEITECSFLGVLEPDKVGQEILKSDFACSYVSPKLNYAINTKVIEAAALRIPIILLSKQGAVSDFLIRNNLGIHVNCNNISSQAILKWYHEKQETGPWKDFKEFDINLIIDNKIITTLDSLK